MLDCNIPFQRAADGGEWIADMLGDDTDVTVLWKTLRDMETRRLVGFLRYGYGGQAIHRHYKTFARTLPQAAEHILENYDGDPRKIWTDNNATSHWCANASTPCPTLAAVSPTWPSSTWSETGDYLEERRPDANSTSSRTFM